MPVRQRPIGRSKPRPARSPDGDSTSVTSSRSVVTTRRDRPPADEHLWLVATPIGNLGDLAPRAVDTLRHAALICCEDTRRTGRLLQHAGIKAQRLAVCNDHTELARIADVLDVLGRRRRRGDRQRRRHARHLRPGRADRAGRHRRRLHRGGRSPDRRSDHGAHDQRAADRPVRVRGLPAAQGSRPCAPDSPNSRPRHARP